MSELSVNDELINTLLHQVFSSVEQTESELNEYRESIKEYVKIDNSVAVLSDLKSDCSYIYAGSFGEFFGLPSNLVIDSVFEDLIFDKIDTDDLTERHILELRYFQFQKQNPINERVKYSTFSRLRATNTIGERMYINHRTLYPKSFPNGSIWLALCLYTPCADQTFLHGIDGKIVNNQTGEIIAVDSYKQYDGELLSQREVQILTLIAQGVLSKQIAGQLNISLNTVHRHRQNIIKKMQVVNATQAVKTAVVMGLITPSVNVTV